MWWLAVIAVVLGACGGADDAADAGAVDAPAGGSMDTSIGCEWTASCNPVSQTGCCPGDKCGFVLASLETGTGYIDCIRDGPAEIGQSCIPPIEPGAGDDCAAGGHCYRGTCHEICTTVNDLCPDGTCVGFYDDIGNPIPVEICVPTCDPLAQDCPDGEGCYLTRDDPICIEAGALSVGEPCTRLNDCAPGLICIGADAQGFTCHALCGPWPDCFDGDAVSACNCGGCGADEICFALGDGMGGTLHDTAGACIPAAEASCDCTADPICP